MENNLWKKTEKRMCLKGSYHFRTPGIWWLVCLRTWPTSGTTQINLLNVKPLGDMMPKWALIPDSLGDASVPWCSFYLHSSTSPAEIFQTGLPSTGTANYLIVTQMYEDVIHFCWFPSLWGTPIAGWKRMDNPHPKGIIFLAWKPPVTMR